MKRLLFLAFLSMVCLFGSSAAKSDEITVSAAASLADALAEIGKTYETKSRNRTILNFGASSDLARQIDEGAPVDVFFSADLEKMEALEAKGLIEKGSRRNLLSNQLVIVVPLDSKLTIRAPRDLLSPDVRRIGLAEPSSVPAGIYARKYLETQGIWERLKDRVIPLLNVRATLVAVELGNVDVGFVYRTDAVIAKKARVAHEIPPGQGPQIVYPVALLKESRKKETGREFLRFLSGDTAKRIFQKHGFVVLN